MPSLPVTTMNPAHLLTTSYTISSDKYREVAYHLNGRDGYVAQSYEVRLPSRRSPSLSSDPSRFMMHASLTKRSSLEGSGAKLNSSKSMSKKTVVVVQSRECVLQDQAHKARVVKSSELTVPPPTSRPSRLATPDLSDIDDDRPFCHCDFRKERKCASCQ